jgi:hypothetical protein
VEVLHQQSARKDLPFGQQYVCGVFPWENKHQPCLSKGEVYFGHPDFIRQTIRINPSCYIWTMDHIITADDSKEIEILSKWLDWTWMLGQLFQQPEIEMVTSAIYKLRSKISGKFDGKILLHKLEIMTKEAKENPMSHWTFTTPRAMIGGAIKS